MAERLDATIITLDIDWAPDFVIDAVADMFIQANVKATWFITHRSPALERLRARQDLFELGIHPNFLPGSTHGETPSEILRHCMALVPEATAMRTHSLMQSSPLLWAVVRETPIRLDASIFLPRATCVEPVAYPIQGETLWRIPYVWEDDVEMEFSDPRWHLVDMPDIQGPRVFDFHPIHAYLNASSMKTYSRAKALGALSTLGPADLAEVVEPGDGTRTMLQDLLLHLGPSGCSRTLGEIAPFLLAPQPAAPRSRPS